jgi:predicted Zn-dependent protease
VGLGQITPALLKTLLKLYGVGATVGVFLPWGRTQELEADRIGLILIAKAGYNPSTAIAFWQRMARVAGDKPAEFRSTHPSDDTRVAQFKQRLPEAL